MRRWKVILVAKILLGFATVGTALGKSLPGVKLDSPTPRIDVRKLSNGEVWAFIPDLNMGSQMGSGVAGSFMTQVVVNNEDQSIGGSFLMRIEGDCQTKTFQILSVIPFSGQWRTGVPEMYEELGFRDQPDGILRRALPGAPMGFVFAVNCKP